MASGEFIISLANEGGSREFLETRESSVRFSGRKSRLIRARDEKNRRFTARDASRRLIKTESTRQRKHRVSWSSDIFDEARRTSFILCTYAFRVRETGLRRIIIPFQVNGLYLAMSKCISDSRLAMHLACGDYYCIPDAIAVQHLTEKVFSYNHLYLNERKINFIKFE